VTVEVKVAKKKWRAIVTARDAGGETLARYEVKAKKGKLAKATAAKAWKQLGPSLPVPPAAAPAPEAAVAAAPAPEPTSDEVAVTAAAAPRRRTASVPWLELAVAGRPFLRTLRYRDDYEERLRPYDLAAPAAAVSAVWRPGASWYAVHADLELAVGVSGSRTTDGMTYPTSSSEWSAGLRGEIPTGAWLWIADASYGEHRFAVDDDAMGEELVPDVTYRWLRAGFGTSVPVARKLRVDAGGGWRQLLGTGDLATEAWFPRIQGNGIDAHLGGTYRAAGAVSLFLRADLRRYFFAMRPEVGDPLIVGGAVDQYLSISAGLVISLR
jgi:hypothetical protein